MDKIINNEIVDRVITVIPQKDPETGIDTKKTLPDNILDGVQVGGINLTSIQSLTQTAQNREQTYELIDAMAQDDVISAVLETYAEDTIQTNDQGKTIWVESDNPDILAYTSWLIDSLNIDKRIYQWAYCLVTYGDVYVRLFRESDVQDDLLFNNAPRKKLNEDFNAESNKLNEDVKLKIYSNNDKYVPYVQMVDNPAEMFDLQRFGKTYGYIKAPVSVIQQSPDKLYDYLTHYTMKQKDVEIFDGTCFVHGCLENTNQRQPETVDIFLENYNIKTGEKDKFTNFDSVQTDTNDSMTSSYTVRRGQSILYNVFKIWREMNLLELSTLLNRLTKSSVVRILTIDTGDMPKEQVQTFTQRLKEKIEQKSAVNVGKSMQDYTAAGPIENTIYVPVHGTQGQINVQNVGGDFDPKSLVDLEYFRDKLFGALKVPKQFFGQTGDSAGFDAGKSLSIMSSRYGKTIKRMQLILCEMVTDIINLFLIDRGMTNYVNKFKVRMQTPVTQEEIDKRANTDTRVRYVGDVMNQLNDIEDKAVKLKIYRALIQNVINDPDVVKELDDYINTLTPNSKEAPESSSEDENSLGDILNSANGSAEEQEESLELPESISEESEEKEVLNEDNDDDSYLLSPEELNLEDK